MQNSTRFSFPLRMRWQYQVKAKNLHSRNEFQPFELSIPPEYMQKSVSLFCGTFRRDHFEIVRMRALNGYDKLLSSITYK